MQHHAHLTLLTTLPLDAQPKSAPVSRALLLHHLFALGASIPAAPFDRVAVGVEVGGELNKDAIQERRQGGCVLVLDLLPAAIYQPSRDKKRPRRLGARPRARDLRIARCLCCTAGCLRMLTLTVGGSSLVFVSVPHDNLQRPRAGHRMFQRLLYLHALACAD